MKKVKQIPSVTHCPRCNEKHDILYEKITLCNNCQNIQDARKQEVGEERTKNKLTKEEKKRKRKEEKRRILLEQQALLRLEIDNDVDNSNNNTDVASKHYRTYVSLQENSFNNSNNFNNNNNNNNNNHNNKPKPYTMHPSP